MLRVYRFQLRSVSEELKNVKNPPQLVLIILIMFSDFISHYYLYVFYRAVFSYEGQTTTLKVAETGGRLLNLPVSYIVFLIRLKLKPFRLPIITRGILLPTLM